jgi:hypothetical protein
MPFKTLLTVSQTSARCKPRDSVQTAIGKTCWELGPESAKGLKPISDFQGIFNKP